MPKAQGPMHSQCPMQVTVPVPGCDLGTLCKVDDPGLLAFLSQLLAVDPGRRPTAAEALEHPWLQQQLEEDLDSGGLDAKRGLLPGYFSPPTPRGSHVPSGTCASQSQSQGQGQSPDQRQSQSRSQKWSGAALELLAPGARGGGARGCAAATAAATAAAASTELAELAAQSRGGVEAVQRRGTLPGSGPGVPQAFREALQAQTRTCACLHTCTCTCGGGSTPCRLQSGGEHTLSRLALQARAEIRRLAQRAQPRRRRRQRPPRWRWRRQFLCASTGGPSCASEGAALSLRSSTEIGDSEEQYFTRRCPWPLLTALGNH